MKDLDLDYILSHCKKDKSGCIIWNRALNSDGYPRVGRNRFREDGTKFYDSNIKVHRMVYELHSDDSIPEGYVVRHTCDEPKCLNPDHLILGTPSDNMSDRHERNRTHNQVLPEEIASVKRLRNRGLKYKEIGLKLNISNKRVEYILTRL